MGGGGGGGQLLRWTIYLVIPLVLHSYHTCSPVSCAALSAHTPSAGLFSKPLYPVAGQEWRPFGSPAAVGGRNALVPASECVE